MNNELRFPDLLTLPNLEKMANFRANHVKEKATQLIPLLRSMLGFPDIDHLIAALAVLPQGTFYYRHALVALLSHWDDRDENNKLNPDDYILNVNQSRSRAMRVFVDGWIRERNHLRVLARNGEIHADPKPSKWVYAAYNEFHYTVAEALKIPANIPDYTNLTFAGVSERIRRSRSIPTISSYSIRMVDWLDAARELPNDALVSDILEGKYLVHTTILNPEGVAI